VLFEAVGTAVRALEDPHASQMTADPALADCAARLAPRYLDDAWTWRR
jgi:hypothetical protein